MEQHLGSRWPSNSPEEPDRRFEVRITRSNPHFKELFTWMDALAKVMNPQRWADICKVDYVENPDPLLKGIVAPIKVPRVSESERNTAIYDIKRHLSEVLAKAFKDQQSLQNEAPLPVSFRDFIKDLDTTPIHDTFEWFGNHLRLDPEDYSGFEDSMYD